MLRIRVGRQLTFDLCNGYTSCIPQAQWKFTLVEVASGHDMTMSSACCRAQSSAQESLRVTPWGTAKWGSDICRV
jgi:hypothetical protein